VAFFKHQKTTVALIQNNIKKHDVVLAYYQNRYILHRIIKINGDNITLSGDGAFLKEQVKQTDILGKVISYQTRKTINVESKGYKIRVFLWVYNPLRKIILRLKR